METMESGQPAKKADMQGKKFSGIKPEIGNAPKGMDFGAALKAIKGKTDVERSAWGGSITLRGMWAGENLVGLEFKTAVGVGMAGLHNNDLLAEDWITV